MNERNSSNLHFIHITSGSSAAGGHTLYGLTENGDVFVFQRGLNRWKPMPMLGTTASSDPAGTARPA